MEQKGKNDNRDPLTMHNLRQRNFGAWVWRFLKKVEIFHEVIVEGSLTKAKVKRKIVLKPNQKHLAIDSYHFHFSSSLF
jgi:hypothetical protein